MAVAVLGIAGCGANFDVVEDGVFYRSAQLSPEQLAGVIAARGIRTVVNLRGPNRGKEWYDAEKGLCDAAGVRLVDIPMSARRLPHRVDLLRLLDTYAEAAPPFLVHCRSGADRTGEASAIWALERLGHTKERALGQLDLWHGHLECWYPAKRYFIRLWQGEAWAREVYDPCSGEYSHYDREAYCD